VDNIGQILPRGKLDDAQSYIYRLNSKWKKCLFCASSKEETSKVHAMFSAKEMWDTLHLARDGSKEVRRSELTIIRHQYETFTMEENESIQSMVVVTP